VETVVRTSFKFAIGAAVLAVAQLAAASTAEVNISKLTLSVSGGEWWYWLPGNVDWLAQTAGTSVQLQSPSFDDSASAWHGTAIASSVADGGSFAQATLTGATAGDFNGVTASAKVFADNGQSGWAFANIFNGQIMVGGNATITVSATIDNIGASGSVAQANAFIELCSTDFVTDVCDAANYTEAFVDASSGNYSGPSILTASWTNPGATTWAKMHIGLTASAESVATPVPEPSSAALLLAGLACGGALMRRYRRG
jgi:hypothetical protein